MAGLNCGTPSLSAWKIIHDLADAFISIGDEWAEDAIRSLHKAGYQTCESGAAGLAGLMALYYSAELKPVKEHFGFDENSSFLVFNTEGITDPEMFRKITAW